MNYKASGRSLRDVLRVTKVDDFFRTNNNKIKKKKKKKKKREAMVEHRWRGVDPAGEGE